jgi:hypothetical protein
VRRCLEGVQCLQRQQEVVVMYHVKCRVCRLVRVLHCDVSGPGFALD